MLDARPAKASRGPYVNTIDSSTNEPSSNFLKNARILDPGAGAHASTVYAVANLTVQGPILMRITGHGQTGLIVTGTGQVTIDIPRYMSPVDQSFWAPIIARLRGRPSAMELWGCDVGAGPKGSLFVSELANALGSPVSALTGNVTRASWGSHHRHRYPHQARRP